MSEGTVNCWLCGAANVGGLLTAAADDDETTTADDEAADVAGAAPLDAAPRAKGGRTAVAFGGATGSFLSVFFAASLELVGTAVVVAA